MVGGVLAGAVALHSSRGLQRGARRGAAAGQAGRGRNPLRERQDPRRERDREMSRPPPKNTIGAPSEHVAPRRTSNQLPATICPSIIGVCILHSRSQGSAGGDPSCLGVRAVSLSRDSGYFKGGRTCKVHAGRPWMGLKPTTFSKFSK